MNRRERDRRKDRKREKGSEKRRDKERHKRRSERVNCEDREDDKEREKRKAKEKMRRRMDRERAKSSDSEREEDEVDRRSVKEKEHREHERDRGRDRKRDRETTRELDKGRVKDGETKDRARKKHESNEGSDDDVVKRDLKRTRKEREEQVDDDEVEKRRRRVHEWQQSKSIKEESQSESKVPEAGKPWTLEGESDDKEKLEFVEMDVDGEIKRKDGEGANMLDLETTVSVSGGGRPEDEEVIDPLDAYMNSMVLPEVEKLSNSAQDGKNDFGKALGRIIQGEDSDSDFDYAEPKNDDDPSLDEEDEQFMKRVKKTKTEKLSLVDHSKIEYEPFRKNFYIQVKDISRMTQEVVNAHRNELELKVHGKDVPRPIQFWHQTGLTSKILDTLKKLGYEKPMPIQAQALPIIMSGRDCIGVAKTGSGKTLAFVLPMLRHIKDQPPVESGDGPIGLVMAPTRELVRQIHSDIKKFAKALGVRCVPVYGGSGVSQQISDLKRGTEIVVCTPGRMIDILCTSNGKISNLRRVTFLVMDEADRMFDMGFEPQITRIVQNIQPDRQTVLFSATFPRQVESLSRKVLNKPVEIQVGGRSVVNKDITQLVEIRPESERYARLLELLGEWYEKGKVLVFVRSQEKCDVLYMDLRSKSSYPCLSLHGGKDQSDRESTIFDFKNDVCNLLIVTSVAARGLDVKELELVVNFDAPNHYEDYVHRVGRTGRAGRKGLAVTFISEEEARYAPDLVKALELSEQPVPDDLKAIADGFMTKVKQGIEQAHGIGYGGSGFKFNEEEENVRKAAKKAQAKEYGFEEDKSDSEDENDVVREAAGDISQQQQQHQATLVQITAIAAAAAAAAKASAPVTANQLLSNGFLPVTVPGFPSDRAGRVAATVSAANLQHNLAKIQADAMPEHYEAELEINDFPPNARWKVTHKETLVAISEWSGAAITSRGQHYASGRVLGPGERKLYLFIEGPTEQSVKTAKAELKFVLEDMTNQALSLPGGAQAGRYSVL